MAGLLDFFGEGWDDPKSNAVMALAGGLLDGDFASGLKGYSQVMAGAKDAQLKRAMQQAQIDKYGADTEMDKQKLTLSQGKEKRDSEFEAMFNNAIKQRLGGGVAMPNMPVTGSQDSQGSGMPSGGNQSSQDPFAGVNPMAMMLDMRNNGGKKLGDWVNDRTAPKWENINGNMVNTNAPNFQGGFQAGMKASDNGQMSMWQPDGQGGLVVGAPRGALETYSAYRNADELAKARTSTTDYTPPGGLPVRMTRAQELALLNGQQPAPMQQPTAKTPNNYFSGTTDAQKSDAMAILQQELRDPKTPPQYIAGLQREIARLGGAMPQSQAPNTAPQSAPSFGLPLQSLSEKERMSAENDAYKTKLVEQAKADVVPTQAKQANIASAQNALSVIDKALAHPGLGVATGLSGAIDPRNYVPGQVGKDYKSIQNQLEGKAFLSAFEQLKGGGAISEKEGEKAQQAIARMSLSQSEKEYRQGLKDYKEVIQTGLSRMKGEEPKKQDPKSLQEYGYKSNDDVLRDAKNTIMRNPQSKAEVERRLQSMGLSLGGR